MFKKCIVLLILAACLCSCSGNRDTSLLLKDWEDVCLPIDPVTLLSMDEALKEKGYGNVMVSDSKIVFKYASADFNGVTEQGIVVYSSERDVPEGNSYIKMRVWSCYEAAIADEKSAGILVNPGVSTKNPFVVTKPQMSAALPNLPRQPALPEDIYIKGEVQLK